MSPVNQHLAPHQDHFSPLLNQSFTQTPSQTHRIQHYTNDSQRQISADRLNMLPQSSNDTPHILWLNLGKIRRLGDIARSTRVPPKPLPSAFSVTQIPSLFLSKVSAHTALLKVALIVASVATHIFLVAMVPITIAIDIIIGLGESLYWAYKGSEWKHPLKEKCLISPIHQVTYTLPTLITFIAAIRPETFNVIPALSAHYIPSHLTSPSFWYQGSSAFVKRLPAPLSTKDFSIFDERPYEWLLQKLKQTS